MDINYVMLIPIIFVVLMIIIIIIAVIKSNKKEEPTTSILDIKEVGVQENEEFSYGYEKEETVVMNPISTDENIKDNKSTDETKKEDKISEINNDESAEEEKEEDFPDLNDED